LTVTAIQRSLHRQLQHQVVGSLKSQRQFEGIRQIPVLAVAQVSCSGSGDRSWPWPHLDAATHKPRSRPATGNKPGGDCGLTLDPPQPTSRERPSQSREWRWGLGTITNSGEGDAVGRRPCQWRLSEVSSVRFLVSNITVGEQPRSQLLPSAGTKVLRFGSSTRRLQIS
jgi:hypothetical protein